MILPDPPEIADHLSERQLTGPNVRRLIAAKDASFVAHFWRSGNGSRNSVFVAAFMVRKEVDYGSGGLTMIHKRSPRNRGRPSPINVFKYGEITTSRYLGVAGVSNFNTPAAYRRSAISAFGDI